MQLSDLILSLVSGEITLDRLSELKKDFSRTHKLPDLTSNIDLLQEYRRMVQEGTVLKNLKVEELLKKRAIRSKSGIVAVQVLTKPFWCPGKCIFCPNDPTMPKSYIKTEPGAARALLNQFDPLKQAYNRLTSLTLAGHATDKIEMIVLGGTWDVYPQDYKIAFIKGLYDACNAFGGFTIVTEDPNKIQGVRGKRTILRRIVDFFFGAKNLEVKNKEYNKYAYTLQGLETVTYSETLEEAIQVNETAAHRIIGLTVETRPEYVTHENCQLWRSLGVTRLEMGVQSLFDEVLEVNKRGHTVEQIREACHMLRQYGFKFSVHIMPGLYQSTTEKDLETFKRLYSDVFLLPDEIKFYPTSVIPGTELARLYHEGKYVPLATQEIIQLIETTFLEIIPAYTRIKRLIRDIPATEIEAGSSVTNLHQLVQEDLLKRPHADLYPRLKDHLTEDVDFDTASSRNFVCLDTRSREVRNRIEGKPTWVKLIKRCYESSVGKEYFLSFEDELGYLYGFTRLLLPKAGSSVDVAGLGEGTAIIRELHVYGDVEGFHTGEGKSPLTPLSNKGGNNLEEKVQHTGLGRQLLEAASVLAKDFHYQKLSVISGVGVRGYYRKLGYELEGTYMVKGL